MPGADYPWPLLQLKPHKLLHRLLDQSLFLVPRFHGIVELGSSGVSRAWFLENSAPNKLQQNSKFSGPLYRDKPLPGGGDSIKSRSRSAVAEVVAPVSVALRRPERRCHHRPKEPTKFGGWNCTWKNAGLDWWDWWLHDLSRGELLPRFEESFSDTKLHTCITMILSKSHKQLVVSTVNVTSLILISRGNLATIEVERGKVPQLFSQSIQSPNEVLLSLLSNKEYSSWWFDTWYYDWNWQGLIWQDHPPQADNKVREDRASMAKLARSSRAHRAMRPRCKAICDMSVTSGQRHQPRANSPLSDPLWAKHWGLSIKLWQSCFCLLQLSMLHNIPWLTAVSVHGHWNKWKDLSSFL